MMKIRIVSFLILMHLIFCIPSFADDLLYFSDYATMLSHAAERPIAPPTPEQLQYLGPLWPDLPPERNALSYFLKAGSLLAFSQDAPAGSLEVPQLGPYKGDLAAFSKWIDSNAGAMRALKAGLDQEQSRLPMLFDEDGISPTFFAYRGLRRLSRNIGDAGFYEELRGQPYAAAEWYLNLVQYGSLIRRQGTMIDCMVGININENPGMAMLCAVIADGQLSESTLRGILQRLAALEIAEPEIQETWSMDIRFVRGIVAATPPSKLTWDPAEYKRLSDALTLILDRMSLIELLKQDTIAALYAGELAEFLPSDSIDTVFTWIQSIGRHNVQLAACRTVAAIALYRLSHGKAPDTLDALCPEFLPSVPVDPFSGQPMCYEITQDGWKLWSVGADNKDDGGTGTPNNLGEENADFVFTSDWKSNIDQRSGK